MNESLSGRRVAVSSEYYDADDATNHCPVCHAPDFSLLYRVEHFGFPIDFYRCSCGTIKQVPMPNEAFFEWFFNSDLFFSSKGAAQDEIWGFYDYFKDESSRLRTSRRRFLKLSGLLNWDVPRSIMKIGPSTGTFLHAAKQAGHHVRGCDVSDQFVKFAWDHYQVSIDHGRYERMGYSDESFDAVLLFNVIENVPNIEEFVAAITRTLKRGRHFILNHVETRGNLVLAMQRDKYFLFRPPICYAFEGAGLDRLLARHGLQLRYRMRDIRYLHLEKISTLLRWRWLHSLGKTIGVSRVEFPVWAYPSWISVFERTQ